MAKYDYHIETDFRGEWTRMHALEGGLEFLRGWLLGVRDIRRMNPKMRLVRSDGRVMEELEEQMDVPLGMIAGFPTPEQYEKAAARALETAKRIREMQARRS